MLRRLMLALIAETPFKLAYLRAKHLDIGHSDSIRIDKIISERHTGSDSTFIFTVNIMKCKECGLIWYDKGLEHRDRTIFNPRRK